MFAGLWALSTTSPSSFWVERSQSPRSRVGHRTPVLPPASCAPSCRQAVSISLPGEGDRKRSRSRPISFPQRLSILPTDPIRRLAPTLTNAGVLERQCNVLPSKVISATHSPGAGSKKEERGKAEYLRHFPGDTIRASWQSFVFSSVVILSSK